jgi:hypothetical protein
LSVFKTWMGCIMTVGINIYYSDHHTMSA